jgi:hypothetical protein
MASTAKHDRIVSMRPSVSNVVRRTAEQIRGQVAAGVILIAMDAKTLRAHIKRGPVVWNVDIAYDERRDLYDVSIHSFRPDSFGAQPHTVVLRCVYAEQLGPLLAGV